MIRSVATLAPQQHGFETIDLRLHVGRAPELHVKLVLLAFDLNALMRATLSRSKR